MKGIWNMRSMPSDFPEHANETLESLMKRYRAGANPVRRWKQLCGTYKPWKRALIRIDDDGNEKHYESAREAVKDIFAGDPSNIYHAMKRGYKAYGYKWQYETDE